MLFVEGTKVRFKNTGDRGVITKMLDLGMAQVLLDDDDMEIPAFLENLERIEDDLLPNKKPIKAKFLESQKPKVPSQPPSTKVDPQYVILKSLGIQLAFDPQYGDGDVISSYRIYLINDTRYEALFTYKIDIIGLTPKTINGKIESVSYMDLGEMRFAQLNEAPIIDMDIWQLTTVGTGNKLSKTLKIKPKQFFKNVRTVPLLDKQMHWYQLFENFDKEEKTGEDDLKTYTKKVAQNTRIKNSNLRNVGGIHPEDFANFDNEIDLHIENLTSNAAKLSNAEIIRIQLNHFDKFLEKAIRLGVDNIFVIHGLGKGKLKSEIATRLINHPHVKTFKNEYHHKYGFGATEVIL